MINKKVAKKVAKIIRQLGKSGHDLQDIEFGLLDGARRVAEEGMGRAVRKLDIVFNDDGIESTTYNAKRLKPSYPAEVEKMIDALRNAAQQFAAYEESHLAKGTEDGNNKAAVNHAMAALCLGAIGEPITGPTGYMLGLFPTTPDLDYFKVAIETLLENGYEHDLDRDGMREMLVEVAMGVIDASPATFTFTIGANAPDTPENLPVQHDSAVSGAPVPLGVAARDAAIVIRQMMTDACEWMVIPDDRTGHFHEGLDQHMATIERYFASGATPDVVTWITRKANHARTIGHADIATAFEALVAEMGHGLHEQPIDLEAALRQFCVQVHEANVKAGWWSDIVNDTPKKRSVAELMLLIVTEVSEAYGAWYDNTPDDKLPEYPGVGVELGDVMIRLADFMGALMAGRIVTNSHVANPAVHILGRICEHAEDYEAIRKTPKAIGEPETGDALEPMDPIKMVFAKLAYNATRKDHKVEERLKEGGKRT